MHTVSHHVFQGKSPSVITITGIGKHFYGTALLFVLSSLAFIALFNDLSFTVRYPVLSCILYMVYGLSYPYLISRENGIRDKQKNRLALSQSMAAFLNEELHQAVQAGALPPAHICTICKERVITDKHYQLCSMCKHKYAGEILRVRAQRYRAQQARTEVSLTVVEWLQTVQAFHFLCAYCQKAPFTVMDHFIPIDKHGGTTKENCIPACAKCNGHKYNKKPEA